MRSLYRIMKASGNTGIQEGFEYTRFDKKKEKPPKPKEEEASGEPEVNEEEEKAKSIIEESRRKAAEILEAARIEADGIRREAYDEGASEGRQAGYDAGYQEGFREGKSEYDEKIRELEKEIVSYIEDLEVEKQKMLEAYMDDLKAVSISIGEKIVKTSLRSGGKVVERMILAATSKLKKSAWAKIYIGSGRDSGMEVKADPKFLQELSHLSDNVKVIVIEGTEAGTCIVERPDEIIDLSVGTQLENIREIMNNARL